MTQKDIELILLRQWASYLTMAVFLIGADGMLLFYNEPAESLLGQRFDEVGEVPLERISAMWQTVNEDGSPIPSDELSIGIALLQRQPAHQVVWFRALDGTHRKVDVTALPLTGQGNRNLGAVAFFWESPT